MYPNLTSRGSYGKEGEVTGSFRVSRGVRQGCVLAPLLFSLYIDGVVNKLQYIQAEPPRIGDTLVQVLLYADDAVLISQTANGL